MTAVLNAMSSIGYRWNSEMLEDVLRNILTKPEGLTGYPYEDCYWSGSWDSLYDNETHVTTDDEFYGALDYWAGEAEVSAPGPRTSIRWRSKTASTRTSSRCASSSSSLTKRGSR